MVGRLAGCAGAKDMSQGAAAASASPSVADAPAAVASAEAPTGAESVARADAPPQADAGSSPGADADVPASAVAAEPAASDSTTPAVKPARLLGRKQAEIETQLGALRFADGWARPADDALELQFRGGRCVGLRGHVPEDMDCAAVATWLGFDAATYPLRRSDRCEWPGISPKHRLAEGVAGSYIPATREYALTVRR